MAAAAHRHSYFYEGVGGLSLFSVPLSPLFTRTLPMKMDKFVTVVCEFVLKKTGLSVEQDDDFSPQEYFDDGAGQLEQIDAASLAVLNFAERNGLMVGAWPYETDRVALYRQLSQEIGYSSHFQK